MKKFLILFISFFLVIPAFSREAEESVGGVERYAIFVGSNVGGKDNQRLLYAGTDAIAFQKTMSEIGGIPASNAILLLDPSKSDLDDAMQTISDMIRLNKERSKRSEFLFYYSGHSDENALLLGKASYEYSGLKAAISNVPSDVHVVILDSCYSGNFIRTKGGQRRKPFLLDDSSVVKGHAYLSSSSSQEFSQESDEIGSSFFTNAMLTGLRGAADSSGDKKVTLNELYSYAFSETLSKTENTSVGPQHPNYNITLVGSGDLVLSDISNSDSVVMISSDVKGRVIIRDRSGKLVSEINKVGDSPIYLALERGEYGATLITDRMTMQGSFSLRSGKVYELSSSSLAPVIGSLHRVRGEKSSSENSEASSDDEDLKDDNFTPNVPRLLDDETLYVPIEFSIVNNELSSSLNKKIVTPFSLALIRSSVYQVNGAMLSHITNDAEIVRGMQGAGIYNTAGEVHGVQGSGIFNIAEDVHGAQGAGIFNKASGDMHGAQGAGILNVAKDFRGIQGAGIYNGAQNFTGIQGAGILNYAKNFHGVQGAGLVNVAGNVRGMQASGILNYAKELSKPGFQVGFINIAGESQGLQLGLVNFSRNGLFELAASCTNDGYRLVLNSGRKWFYSVLGGARLFNSRFNKDFEDGINSSMIFGLGSRFSIAIVDFGAEILANEVFFKKDELATVNKKGEKEDYEELETEFYPSLHFYMGITPVKHFRVFAGTIFSFESEKNKHAFDSMKKRFVIDKGNCKIYPEYEFGLCYSLN